MQYFLLSEMFLNVQILNPFRFESSRRTSPTQLTLTCIRFVRHTWECIAMAQPGVYVILIAVPADIILKMKLP